MPEPAASTTDSYPVQPNGYLTHHFVAAASFGRMVLRMDTHPANLNRLDIEFTNVWHPCSTVFSARTLDGSEVLLWLIPQVEFSSFLAEQNEPAHEVRFTTMNPRLARDTAEPAPSPSLFPTWWLFEANCTASTCACGPRSLLEALALLPRRAAGQALAAHVDFAEALAFKAHHSAANASHLNLADFAAAAARLSLDLAEAKAVPSPNTYPVLLAS